MTSPYARLIMLLIPNCMVNPTAAMASTEVLTRPKPNAARYKLTSSSPGQPRSSTAGGDHCRGLRFGQRAVLHLVALGVVLDEDVALLRVVVLVVGCGTTGADPLDRLAAGERRDPGSVGVDHDGTADPVADLGDLGVVDGRVGALGRIHGERRLHDAVIEMQGGARLLVLDRVRVLHGRGGQVGEEILVPGAAEADTEVHRLEVLEHVRYADRPSHRREPDRVDGRRGAHERDL